MAQLSALRSLSKVHAPHVHGAGPAAAFPDTCLGLGFSARALSAATSSSGTRTSEGNTFSMSSPSSHTMSYVPSCVHIGVSAATKGAARAASTSSFRSAMTPATNL